MEYRKKFIVVALLSEAINKASAREQSIRHAHPTRFLEWCSRTLVAAKEARK